MSSFVKIKNTCPSVIVSSVYGAVKNSNYFTPYSRGDIVGVLLDFDNFTARLYTRGVPNSQELSIKALTPPLFIGVGGGKSSGSSKSTANFGATEFDIVTSNPSAWQQLVKKGYLPYDYENAKWLKRQKYLFQQNNNILTYDTDISDWKIIGNNTSNLNDLFEEHGTNDIDHIDKTKLNQLSKPIKILCREEK